MFFSVLSYGITPCLDHRQLLFNYMGQVTCTHLLINLIFHNNSSRCRPFPIIPVQSLVNLYGIIQSLGGVLGLVLHVFLSSPQSGYQEALERGNSVPRPKGLCEADKVKLSAVLLQNPKYCNLHVVDILITYESKGFYWSFWQVVKL